MDSKHESSAPHCRFLDESYFAELHHAFLQAFSDYVMPFELNEAQFRNHVVLNAVDLASSVGVFDGGKLIGFTLNGLGRWKGLATIYDAGTGVFPDYRRRGLSNNMFAMMLPRFRSLGYRQCLLEVITINEKAINLYKKLGFQTTRVLSLLHLTDTVRKAAGNVEGIETREIEHADWEHLKTFWDGEPSWQNSPEAIDRSRDRKRFIGAFNGDQCVGYLIYAVNVGRIAQMAVDPQYRRRGIGTVLLRSMIADINEDATPQVINIDRSIASGMAFFEKHGFTERLSQFEMMLEMG